MTYDPTWVRKPPILIPQAIHNEALTAQKGSVRLDALDWGQKVGSTLVDSNQTGSSALALAPLNNGKMFVAWGAGTDGRYAIVDSNGSMDSTAYQTFESGGFLDHAYGIASALLPNGNVIVAYGQDQGASNALVFKIFDESGTVVRDTVTVKVHATETSWSVGVAALSDGRIVLTWQEAAAGNMSYYAMFDIDGDIIKSYTSLGGNYGNPQPAAMSDGNWIVTYENSGVRYRTFDRQGIQVVGETLFRTGVSQAQGIQTLGNGQIVIPFVRGFGIIDRHGNVVVTPETKEVAGSYSITVLPHDNILAQNNNGTNAYYKIYDSEGNLLNTQVTYATTTNAIGSGDVATFKNGNFMLAFVETNTNTLNIVIHQGTKAGFGGDLAISGSLSLATGASVNEISTDNTLAGDSDNVLVTEKAIKHYVDNSIGDLSHVRIYDGDSEVKVTDDAGDATSAITITLDGAVVATFSELGLNLAGSAIIADRINNDVLMGGSNGATGSQTALVTEYAARSYVDNINAAQNEPTGFPEGNSNAVTTVGIDGSNTIYIEPAASSFDVFMSGQRWTFSTRQEVTISDTEGIHYIYFDDADGVLKETMSFSLELLYTKAYVAIVYWDATNKEIIYYGDERHGCTMDGKTHYNIHTYRGTLYNGGLALADITADSTSATNTDAQFSMTSGTIVDEDISHTLAAESFPATIPMFYLSGASNWRYETADNFAVVNTGTGRVAWNELSGATWSLTEATDGAFVLTHIFATNDPNKPVVGIVGQNEYTTITLARAGATTEINALIVAGLPFAEFCPVATLIFETSDSFANTPKAIIRSTDAGADWVDWRTSGLSSAPGSATDHGALSGLEDDDHLQYYLLTGIRPISGNLTVEGTTTLEAGVSVTGGSLTLATGASVNEISTDGTLADNSNTAIPTEQAVKTYVDTSIDEFSTTEIYSDDSYVKVVDDGTATGYVEIVTDGVQVAYFDALASTQRIGKESAAGRIEVSDTTLVGSIGASDVFTFAANTQIVGISSDTYLTLNQSADTVTVHVAAGQVLSLGTTSQTIGVSGDSRLELDQSANTVDLYAGSVNVLSASDTTQRFGASGDTALTLNTSADTFTLSAGANTQISGSLTSLSLGVAGDTTIVLDQSTDSISITAGGQSQILVETQGTTVYDDLTVTGNLFVDGTTFVVHQTEVKTADNLLTLNYGEPGEGVTAGEAGIEIDRGTLVNYYFMFDEATDTFRIGESGDTQAVATREDNPTAGRFAYWNDVDKRFDTEGDTFISFDATSDDLIITENSVNVATFSEDGIKLENGVAVNEFSTDGTLSGDSDTAVPTEKAVKTYVDSTIESTAYKIFLDDSYVQIVDDGTSTGYVEIVTDGVQVAYFDPLSSTQRIGKATESRILVADDTLTFYAGVTPSIQATLNASGLTLASGDTVNAFSSDSTMASASDAVVPTQLAIKTYTDTGDSNTLSSANSYTDGEISTLTTYVNDQDSATLTAAEAYADAGDATTLIDAIAYADAQDAATLASANSYTDTEINNLRNELDLINVETISADTTAVSGDVILVDTTASDVNIELIQGVDTRVIIKKKTTDGNRVYISASSGTIDGQNLVIIDTPYQSFTFVSDGSNFFII